MLSDKQIMQLARENTVRNGSHEFCNYVDFARAVLAAALPAPSEPDMEKIERDVIFHASMTCLPAITQAYRYFRAQGKTEEDFDRCAYEAMARAIRNAVDLTAREVKDPVWPYAKDAVGINGLTEEETSASASVMGIVGAAALPVQRAAPYRSKNVDVALNMCREANLEATLPVPMCWDLALYVKRLEDAVTPQPSPSPEAPSERTAGVLGTVQPQQEKDHG